MSCVLYVYLGLTSYYSTLISCIICVSVCIIVMEVVLPSRVCGMIPTRALCCTQYLLWKIPQSIWCYNNDRIVVMDIEMEPVIISKYQELMKSNSLLSKILSRFGASVDTAEVTNIAESKVDDEAAEEEEIASASAMPSVFVLALIVIAAIVVWSFIFVVVLILGSNTCSRFTTAIYADVCSPLIRVSSVYATLLGEPKLDAMFSAVVNLTKLWFLVSHFLCRICHY